MKFDLSPNTRPKLVEGFEYSERATLRSMAFDGTASLQLEVLDYIMSVTVRCADSEG